MSDKQVAEDTNREASPSGDYQNDTYQSHADAPHPLEVRGESSKRPIVFGVLAGLLIGALAGALTMASAFPRPDTSAIDAAQQVVRVTAAVSAQPTRTVFTLLGSVTAHTTVAVLPNAAGTVGMDVVSGHVHAVGDVINQFDVIAEVSNRPVFALLASVPLFRDLAPDMTGTDVIAVQRALIDAGLLKRGPTGTMDAPTSTAITKLFKSAGYVAPNLASVLPQKPDPDTGIVPDPPTRAGLPLADTAWIPAADLRIAEASKVGQILDADNPMVQLATQMASIAARADVLAVASFDVGTSVMVQIGSNTPVESKVLAVSTFNNDGATPGYDLTIAMPDGIDASVTATQPVIVTEMVPPPTGPAVPLAAIRTDNQGTFVFAAAKDETAPDVRIDVTVLGQANGYAILEENTQLSVGTTIVLAGERI
ncbi:MAG: hypothetical protein FWD80_00165 [Propionibacteriaceae bacterium]|nr:hypothetical protein [Propionibacteriaceae bacterium]